MKKFINSLKSFFNNRIAVLIAVLIVLFSILVVHLFNLQIIKGNEYKKSLNSSIEKVISTQAPRGRIFDRNGVLLAYDDIVYMPLFSVISFPEAEIKPPLFIFSLNSILAGWF